MGDEGFVLASLGHSGGAAYVLAGGDGSARGTLYAVYEWLHQLGVRFLAYDETFFPACPVGLGGGGAPLPVLPSKQWLPSLDYRMMTAAPDSPTLGPHYLWLLRNRYNVVLDSDWKAPPNGTWWTPEHGLGWRNAIGFPEATSYTILGNGLKRNGSGPPLKLYNQHRSWFWPNNDSSVDGQLCWSEPSLVAFLTTRVQTVMRQQPNTTLLSLSVLDNHRFCQSKGELAVISEEDNSPIGPLIRALNTIGAAVEAEFPRLTLTTLAYLSFTPPPKTAPRHNVAVRLCSVSCDFGRALSDPTNDCDGFKGMVAKWVALASTTAGGGRIWAWNYEADDEDFVMPWPDYRSVGPNIAWFVQQGVRGVYEESSYMAAGGDFAALKSYTIARMMRDPADDADAIVAEFAFGYYGQAAAPFVLRIVDTYTKAVLTCPGGHSNPLCRLVDWTHISKHNHAMDPGDDGKKAH